jgi:hypothetical protein
LFACFFVPTQATGSKSIYYLIVLQCFHLQGANTSTSIDFFLYATSQ